MLIYAKIALEKGELSVPEQKNALTRQLRTSIHAFTDTVIKSEREHITVQLIKKYPSLKGSVGAGHVSHEVRNTSQSSANK